MRSLEKFKGCLVGGAVGDALGYPIEFYKIEQIKNIYGKNGITQYELTNGKAIISDDTQMTLYTANGILIGKTRAMMRGIAGSCESYVYYAYLDWLDTQINSKKGISCTWLSKIEALNVQRAPGNTCIKALNSGTMGTIENPINESKGCGGVMRVAPLGLYFKDSYELGCKVSAITHGHVLGYRSAGLLSEIISEIIYEKNQDLYKVVLKSLNKIKEDEASKLLTELVNKAIELSKQNIQDETAIKELGEGWVAEECVAISIYCALKYKDNFEKAIIASVNHSGDSDSTGAVTGNILGTYLGISKIPNKFLEKLELREIIEEIAEDLYNDCPIAEYADNSSKEAKRWIEKYIYAGKKE